MLSLPRLPIGDGFELGVDFLRVEWAAFFSGLRSMMEEFINAVEYVISIPPFWLFAILIAVLAYKRAGKGVAIFSFLGIFFIETMDMWPATVSTLSLIITATLIALALALPFGILSAKVKPVSAVMRPILDLMQTMPAFVYLIPSVLLFGIGDVPAVISTIIFAMPPVIRLTELGIRQVPKDLIEAGESFGSLWYQMLFKI